MLASMEFASRCLQRSLLAVSLAAASLVLLACGGSGSDPDATPACVEGATRCQGADVEICESGAWGVSDTCNAGVQSCVEAAGEASCVFDPTCIDNNKNQDETDVDCGGAVCGPCGDGGTCTVDGDCTSDACDNGVCQICKVGEIDCHGNFVRKCNADQQTYETLATCVIGQVCNATTQTCDAASVVGTSDVTGQYHVYASFAVGAGQVFKGGNDVDSFVFTMEGNTDNRIYVNRSGELDVYTVELLDTDGDGELEPHQHPDNPDDTGPVEERVLTFVQTYANAQLGPPSQAEIYAVEDRIFFINGNAIWSFDFATETRTTVVAAVGGALSFLGFDELEQRWYSGSESNRRVHAYYEDGGGWATQFDYPPMAGSHMDGMEVVVDPREDISYVYVSDMTSNFLLQYSKNPDTQAWEQENVFEYIEYDDQGQPIQGQGQAVEGMGFGAFNHFWITSWGALYEVGGGDLQDYVGGGID